MCAREEGGVYAHITMGGEMRAELCGGEALREACFSAQWTIDCVFLSHPAVVWSSVHTNAV